jgi:enoyl-CoA hydratase/carnithine racemase
MTSTMVLTKHVGGVCLLTLNRPEQRNAFNHEMYISLAQCLQKENENKTTKVVVITGNGSAFSSGQDLTEMKLPEEGEEIGFSQLLTALVGAEKPLLTAVNGVAVGIGLTMLLHTDINYFSEYAKLRAPFVQLGVVPEAGSSYLLPAMIGFQQAAEMLFTSRWVSAHEAVSLGLGVRVIPHEILLPVVLEQANQISLQSNHSLRSTKRLLRAARNEAIVAAQNRENETFRKMLGSTDNQAAIDAFFEKKNTHKA